MRANRSTVYHHFARHNRSRGIQCGAGLISRARRAFQCDLKPESGDIFDSIRPSLLAISNTPKNSIDHDILCKSVDEEFWNPDQVHQLVAHTPLQRHHKSRGNQTTKVFLLQRIRFRAAPCSELEQDCRSYRLAMQSEAV